jgi:hypothetical protein
MKRAVLRFRIEGKKVEKFPVKSIESAREKLADLIEFERREWIAHIIDDSGVVGEFMPNLNFKVFIPSGIFIGGQS